MVFYTAFNSIYFQSCHRDSSHYSCHPLVSPVLGLGSEVSVQEHPQKSPGDPMRLKPRTLGLQVKHFATDPHGTHLFPIKAFVKDKWYAFQIIGCTFSIFTKRQFLDLYKLKKIAEKK